MKNLKRMRYYTMSSWNQSESLAYNLKIYNVIDNDLQDRVYELMSYDGFYDDINMLIAEFGNQFNHEWQAGFNGRSGGYLVLYKGGKKLSHKSYCKACGQRNYQEVVGDNAACGRCGKNERINHTFYDVYTTPGLNIEDDDVPSDVKKAFRKLAIDIVKSTEYMARNATIESEYVTTEHKYITV
jgi:hypothetical protein